MSATHTAESRKGRCRFELRGDSSRGIALTTRMRWTDDLAWRVANEPRSCTGCGIAVYRTQKDQSKLLFISMSPVHEGRVMFTFMPAVSNVEN